MAPRTDLAQRNPAFDAAPYRVLIARLSPFADVERSLPHLFLFDAVRRALPEAFIDLAFFDGAADPPLSGLQSRRPLTAFDLLLISNAYILELLNLPFLLLRAGLPLFAGERGSRRPLIILGGSNALAPQALIRADGDSLVDGIFFGEGEGVVGELARFLLHGGGKAALRQAADRFPGFWPAGEFRPVEKAVLDRPAAALLPLDYPLLDGPEAHTAHLQITYGCPAFCAFCFEGYDRKPYRELPAADLLAAARRLKQAHGVEEINLYSFNFNTHSDILTLLPALHRLFDRVGLKSQRIDILHRAEYLLEAEVLADKREFTLGVEGVSRRLRAWLRKSLSDEALTGVLRRLLEQEIRRVKLFYILTGYETETDIAEFRRFLRWLKETRRALRRRIRIIFSFGLLVRMPFTPLRYDRLFLDPAHWRPLIGAVKSACETNGFEFRLAYDWPEYAVTQVLALGGYWLVEPLTALARAGHHFARRLPPGYWDALRRRLERAGHWNADFLGVKGPHYPFPLAFVRSRIPAEFLYRQYRHPSDEGYCLGDADGPGRCLGCGACPDADRRETLIHHRLRQPERGPYLAHLKQVMDAKHRLKPLYFRVRLSPSAVGEHPAFANALVFRGLLARAPQLGDNLLTVRESLFTRRPLAGRFPGVAGETVFALKAWDGDGLARLLAEMEGETAGGFTIGAAVEGFRPGEFVRLHLDLSLPGVAFGDGRAAMERYLRGAYLRYSLRRDGGRYLFDLPRKSLKKRLLFGGWLAEEEGAFRAGLEVGPKFDLGALLRLLGSGDEGRARVVALVSRLVV